MYIKKLRNIYYAHEEIPVELRAKLGRARFKKTLGTSDRREAERRAVGEARPLTSLRKMPGGGENGSHKPIQRMRRLSCWMRLSTEHLT